MNREVAGHLRNRRLAWLVVIMLVAAWFLIIRAIMAPEVRAWSWPFVPAVDGAWRAQSFGGVPVPAAAKFVVDVDGGAIEGGFDGCRNWGFVEGQLDQFGKPMIVADAKECVGAIPMEARYRDLIFAKPALELTSDKLLRVFNGHDYGLFRRAARNE